MATDRALPRRIAQARDGVDDVARAVRAFASELDCVSPPADWSGKSEKSHRGALKRSGSQARDAVTALRGTTAGLGAYRDEIVRRIAAEDRAALLLQQRQAEAARAKLFGSPW